MKELIVDTIANKPQAITNTEGKAQRYRVTFTNAGWVEVTLAPGQTVTVWGAPGTTTEVDIKSLDTGGVRGV